MKKRVVGLLLSFVLSFTLFGCGNNAETRQEESTEVQESNSEMEQESTAGDIKSDIPGEDLSWGYIYNEPQKTDFEPDWEYYELYSDYVEIPMNHDTNFYDDEGNLMGYLYDRKDIEDIINVSAVAEDYVRTRINIKQNLVEVNIKHEDLEDSSQLKDLFAAKKQETEENDVDGSYARQVFERILEQGGMEAAGLELIQVVDGMETGGVMVDIPRENTGEWAKEKRQAFLDNGLKYFYTEGYSWTDYTVSVRLWLGTEDKQPIPEDEISAFFQSESDLDIEKRSNPYYDIFEKVGFDTEKTYTIDEYIEILAKALEELGKKSNVEVASDFREYVENNKTFDGYRVQQIVKVLDFENHEEVSEATEAILNLLQWGADGYGGITEFYIVKGGENQDTVVIYYKTEAAAMEKY